MEKWLQFLDWIKRLLIKTSCCCYVAVVAAAAAAFVVAAVSITMIYGRGPVTKDCKCLKCGPNAEERKKRNATVTWYHSFVSSFYPLTPGIYIASVSSPWLVLHEQKEIKWENSKKKKKKKYPNKKVWIGDRLIGIVGNKNAKVSIMMQQFHNSISNNTLHYKWNWNDKKSSSIPSATDLICSNCNWVQ